MIADAAREMTLEEYVYQLPPIHRARKEYETLKARPRDPDINFVEVR